MTFYVRICGHNMIDNVQETTHKTLTDFYDMVRMSCGVTLINRKLRKIAENNTKEDVDCEFCKITGTCYDIFLCKQVRLLVVALAAAAFAGLTGAEQGKENPGAELIGNQLVERVPMEVMEEAQRRIIKALRVLPREELNASYIRAARRMMEMLVRACGEEKHEVTREPARRNVHRTVVGRTAVRTVRRKATGGGIKKSSDPEPAGPCVPMVINITININAPLVSQPAAPLPLPAPKGSWWRFTRDELTKSGIGLLAIAVTALATKVF